MTFLAMSKKHLEALLAKVIDDTELREKLKGPANLDTAVALAKEAGFNLGKSD